MEVAERAVILRLGKVIWDGLPKDITHDELGELFLTEKCAAKRKCALIRADATGKPRTLFLMPPEVRLHPDHPSRLRKLR